VLNKIIWVIEKIGIIPILGLATVTGIDVAGRFLFNLPLRGDVEISQFFLISLFSLGLILVTAGNEHVIADFFLERLQPASRRKLLTITTLGTAVLLAILTWAGFALSLVSLKTGEATDVLRIPF
jgi:TRAP-type C4-dicarboxylate transport system permease small subunit